MVIYEFLETKSKLIIPNKNIKLSVTTLHGFGVIFPLELNSYRQGWIHEYDLAGYR